MAWTCGMKTRVESRVRMRSKLFVFLFARFRVQVWLDLHRFHLGLSLVPLCLCSSSRSGWMARWQNMTDEAPPRVLLFVLLRFTVWRQRAQWVDWRVAHAAYLDIRLVIAKELFPMCHALGVMPSADVFSPSLPCTHRWRTRT